MILALFTAIIVLFSFTPLGYIPLIHARDDHPYPGHHWRNPVSRRPAFLGGVFGLTSFINNTFNPIITSFVFTPVYSLGEYQGNFWSLVICFVPRILVGLLAGFVFRWFEKRKVNRTVSYTISGLIGSFVNTFLVMGGIYVFFGDSYAAAKDVASDAIFGVIMGVVGVNGTIEAIIAAVLTTALCIPLLSVSKKLGFTPTR
ncbi:MAG: ECF transporter S component [Oscillospiraceae bacterium]